MGVLSAYRERVRGRTDSEHVQALLRAIIAWLLIIETTWVASRNPDHAAAMWAINLFSAAFSVLLLARILQRPQPLPRRWIRPRRSPPTTPMPTASRRHPRSVTGACG